jgi:competence protein ComEA
VKEKIFQFISNLVNKNILVLLVICLMLGGVVGFIFANKKVNTGCVLAMDNKQEETEVKKIIVDLSGAVQNPGIYELDEGSRVGDLLSLGGGTIGDASVTYVSKNLNLSKKLEDSSKVYIPFEWETYSPLGNEILDTVKPEEKETSSNSSSSSNSNTPSSMEETEDSSGNGNENSSRINVNTATSSELDSLPGIGPAFAQKIIDNRSYKDFAEFESKSGLYKSTAESIKELISF